MLARRLALLLPEALGRRGARGTHGVGDFPATVPDFGWMGHAPCAWGPRSHRLWHPHPHLPTGYAGMSSEVATGINILKNGSDPPLKSDEELPEWLWELAQPEKTLAELQRLEFDELTYEEVSVCGKGGEREASGRGGRTWASVQGGVLPGTHAAGGAGVCGRRDVSPPATGPKPAHTLCPCSKSAGCGWRTGARSRPTTPPSRPEPR